MSLRTGLMVMLVAGRFAGALGADGVPLTLVRDGQPAATIFTATDAPLAVQLAVAELNHHIEQMTGVRLPVVEEGGGAEGARVLVGESALTRELNLSNDEFARQEYVVESRPGLLILLGHDSAETGELDYAGRGVWPEFSYYTPVGTLYAVYDFLERRCGVRWYLPTEVGEVIPRRHTLTVPPVQVRRKPWTRYRSLWPQRPMPASLYQWDLSDPEALGQLEKLPDREVWLYWLRQRVGGDFFACNHSFYPWQKRFGESHPEYFAQNPDGTPNLEQLEYASDAVVEQVVQDILACRRGEWEDENGLRRFGRSGENIFALVPMDNRAWSSRAEASRLVLDEPTRIVTSFNTNRASNYIFRFVVKVAERIAELDPEVIISALAYSDYYFPPDDLIFPDNVAIMVCKQQAKARTTRYDAGYYASLQQWRSKVKRLYIWEYYNFPQWRRMNVFPGLVPRRTGADVAFLHRLGIEGEFIEINTARGFPPVEGWLVNPAMQHMNYYFRLKLLENMERPVEELLDEYYRLFYGPAEQEMREFFTLIEDTFMNEDYFRPGHLDAAQSWTVYCPPDRLREFRRLIFRASQAARGQHPYQERVQLMDDAIMDFMQASAKVYHLQASKKVELDCRRVAGAFDWKQAAAAAWQRAAAADDFTQLNGRPGVVQTTARCLWDDEYLYVLFGCAEPEMDKLVAPERPRDDVAFMDDCVELFVDANRDKRTYHHFVVNASGSIYDEVRAYGEPKSEKQWAWNSHVEVELSRSETGWSVATRIPWDDLGRTPGPGDEWGVNFCRHHHRTGANLAWSPTGSSFHVPARFGTVRFAGD